MRKALVTLSTVAFALSAFATLEVASAASAPKLSKLGCMVGKEKWDASIGKCVPGAPVKKAKAAKAPKAPKAAAAAKKPA